MRRRRAVEDPLARQGGSRGVPEADDPGRGIFHAPAGPPARVGADAQGFGDRRAGGGQQHAGQHVAPRDGHAQGGRERRRAAALQRGRDGREVHRRRRPGRVRVRRGRRAGVVGRGRGEEGPQDAHPQHIRPRLDGVGAGGETRPRDRPRAGALAHRPNPLAPHEEQRRPRRRGGRRQDGCRRGARARDPPRRSPRAVAGEARRRARPRASRRGDAVSRPVRGTAQKGHRRDETRRERHPLP